MLRTRISEETKLLIISITSPIVILIAWEILSRSQIIDSKFVPPPTEVLRQAVTMVNDGTLFLHVKATLFRVLIGFFCGAIPAIIIGIVMGLSNSIRAFMRPLIVISYPIPKIALFPLVMLFFGIGDTSNIIIISIGVFFPVLYNTLGGVAGIQRIHWEVATNFGAKGVNLFKTVALPGALPSIFTGLKLGIGMALLTAIVTEYLGAREGLGFMIWFSWQVFSVGEMFVGLAVISIIGFILTGLVEKLEHMVIPWRS